MARVIVDLANEGSWPEAFASLVHQWDDAGPATRHELERAAVRALGGSLLRCFHCTRLTDRELTSVRGHGLRLLSAEFVHQRLVDAVEDGHLSVADAELYGRSRLARDARRAGTLWLFAPTSPLGDRSAIRHLVGTWGGEGIHMALSTRSAEFARLTRVGTPTVVVATIDVAQHYAGGHPGLLSAAAEQRRRSSATTIRCQAPIGADFIESIHHPGDDFRRTHVWTPSPGT